MAYKLSLSVSLSHANGRMLGLVSRYLNRRQEKVAIKKSMNKATPAPTISKLINRTTGLIYLFGLEGDKEGWGLLTISIATLSGSE